MSGFTAEDIADLYSEMAILVRPAVIPRTAPDPDDDVVLGTAVAASAEYIVTGDRTLLSVAGFQTARIVTVREALETIEAQ